MYELLGDDIKLEANSLGGLFDLIEENYDKICGLIRGDASRIFGLYIDGMKIMSVYDIFIKTDDGNFEIFQPESILVFQNGDEKTINTYKFPYYALRDIRAFYTRETKRVLRSNSKMFLYTTDKTYDIINGSLITLDDKEVTNDELLNFFEKNGRSFYNLQEKMSKTGIMSIKIWSDDGKNLFKLIIC